LQHIDFPLPRKHKPALFMAAKTAPLTTTAAPTRRMQRRSASRSFACRSIDSNFQELNDDRLSKLAPSAGARIDGGKRGIEAGLTSGSPSKSTHKL
jgi:hypothetical protein